MQKNNAPDAAALSQARALFEAGQGAFAQAHYAQALDQWVQALQLAPARVSLLTNISAVLIKLQRYPEAETYANQALQQDPVNSMAWKNLLQAREALQRKGVEGASAQYRNVIDTLNDPDRVSMSKAQALIEQQQYPHALAICDGLLGANPAYLPALIGKSVILARSSDQQVALAFIQRALRYHPSSQDLWINHGLILSNLGKHDLALVAYEKAHAINAVNPVARQHLAQAQLLDGNYASGWASYEARFALYPDMQARHAALPRLKQLSAAVGKTVLVWAEQGYGDTIQFCRFLLPLQKMGITVHLEAPAPLQRLLSDNLRFTIKDRIVDESIYAFQIPLLSIPALFLTAEGMQVFVPGQHPYLEVAQTEPSANRRAQSRLARTAPAIGIACSGNPQHVNDAQRSIALEVFLPLTEMADVYLIQPQLRDADQQCLERHSERFKRCGPNHDFLDTAASIADMDYIVSVDTAIAHLAGAMAKPLFLLLPTNPDWRWGHSGVSTPWYPCAKLFRRPAQGSWSETMAQVVAAIESDWGKPFQ